MKFTKMHGLGNDYVYVNCFEEKIDNPPAVARFVSDRHFGIGSDGLIMINPSKTADFEMEMYNADGSRGEMCGNGIRCVAKYVYDYGLTDKTQISVETLGGIKYLDLTVEDGKVSLVKVDMGKPELKSDLIPIISENEKVKQNNNSQNDTIPSENLKVMPFDISHQETDHKDRYNKSNKHAYKQKQQFRYSKCKAEFHQFQQAGTEHYRNCQEKCELSCHFSGYSDDQRADNCCT